jgi:tetratricopeptide (TPR) repeat protein
VDQVAALVAIALAFLSAVGTAAAQDSATPDEVMAPAPDPERDAEARHLFEAGVVAFRDTRFDDALDYFEHAYQLSRRDELLYNLGLACERLGRDAEALDYYRRFIAALPRAENRADVESRIALLERREAERAALAPVAPAQSSSGPGVDPAGVALIVAGGVVAAAGIGLVVAGALDQTSVENSAPGTPWSSVSAAAERSPILSTAGWIALGVGVAGAVTGIVVLVMPSSGGETRARLTPGGVVLEGTF